MYEAQCLSCDQHLIKCLWQIFISSLMKSLKSPNLNKSYISRRVVHQVLYHSFCTSFSHYHNITLVDLPFLNCKKAAIIIIGHLIWRAECRKIQNLRQIFCSNSIFETLKNSFFVTFKSSVSGTLESSGFATLKTLLFATLRQLVFATLKTPPFCDIKIISFCDIKNLTFCDSCDMKLFETLIRSVFVGWAADLLISHLISCTWGRKNNNKVFMKRKNLTLALYENGRLNAHVEYLLNTKDIGL